MKCIHRHLCPEWDYLEIDVTDKEYEACLCECNRTIKNEGDDDDEYNQTN